MKTEQDADANHDDDVNGNDASDDDITMMMII